LLEPQRSNIALFSEQFDNALYIKSNGTITANSVVSPDGTLSADKFESAAAGVPEIIQSTLNASAKTISVYAKAGNVSNFRIWVGSEVNFDLSNGTVVSGAGTIQNAGNGWYRCIVSNTTFTNFNIYFIASASGQFVYLWGAQLEVGAYATSYIPTLGTSVTRVADAASKTSATALIGQTEGVVFLDWIMTRESASTSEDYYPIAISDGTSANMVTLNNYNNKLLAYVSSGGSAVFTNDSFSGSSGLRIKAAIAYKANDFAFYVNGVQIATDNAGAAPVGMSKINVGTYIAENFNDTIQANQVLLFKTRLTNESLAALTSL
jgi:hypothetical protein